MENLILPYPGDGYKLIEKFKHKGITVYLYEFEEPKFGKLYTARYSALSLSQEKASFPSRDKAIEIAKKRIELL